jgi:hypothetical protein
VVANVKPSFSFIPEIQLYNLHVNCIAVGNKPCLSCAMEQVCWSVWPGHFQHKHPAHSQKERPRSEMQASQPSERQTVSTKKNHNDNNNNNEYFIAHKSCSVLLFKARFLKNLLVQ